jgi:hypothetical protein
MNKKLSIVLGSLLGAMLIYCGQGAMQGLDGGIFGNENDKGSNGIKDAWATDGTPVFVKVAEGRLTPEKTWSEAIDVSQYREISCFYSVEGGSACTSNDLGLYYFPAADSPMRLYMPEGRFPIQGPIIKINLKYPEDCTSGSFILLGVK